MLHAHTLHIAQLSERAIAQLSPSFTHLPQTDHADGKYRLRRYSVVKVVDHKVIEMDKHEFMQTEDFNHFQGDVVRQFAPLEQSILQSDGLKEMCLKFIEANLLPNGQEIEIHQMRITAIYDETQVAPEGVHQDGFDHIAMIGIDRHNIVGGEIMLYQDKHEAPFYRKVLENGEITMLADDILWHNAQPIRSVDHDQEGHMDVFVLTAKEGGNDLHS